jgi:cytochrome c nitrite reductase small subunit
MLRGMPLGVGGAVVASLLGLLAGAGGYTAWYAEGASYLSNDPTACVNCHVMREEYDAWTKSSHHGVAVCNDCHLPRDFVGMWWTKAENGFWHSTRFTLQDFHEPIRIRPKNRDVLLGNCVRCHEDVVSMVHEEGIEEPGALGCLRCHANVGHAAVR